MNGREKSTNKSSNKSGVSRSALKKQALAKKTTTTANKQLSQVTDKVNDKQNKIEGACDENPIQENMKKESKKLIDNSTDKIVQEKPTKKTPMIEQSYIWTNSTGMNLSVTAFNNDDEKVFASNS